MLTVPRLRVRDTLRDTQRELTSLLLVGAMLAPVVAAIAGWPVHTPFGVPLLAHVTGLVALGLVWFGVAGRVEPPLRMWRSIEWLLVAPAAATFAAIVRERANVFYTERALVEGMAVLLVVHAGASVLRARTPRRPGAAARLSGVLTRAVGWLVLASWVLIALEHRHPAGPLLLAAGAMQTLALLALVPDALAGAGWLTPHSAARPDGSDRP
jgi:hypothetical protein